MDMFSTYGKLQLNVSTIPMLKITELGFCLAFPWPEPGLSLRLNCDRTCSYHYLGLIFWIQLMILNLDLQASFVDPFLSLIKSILIQLSNHFYLSKSDVFPLRFSTLVFCRAESLGWSKGLRHYCTILYYWGDPCV